MKSKKINDIITTTQQGSNQYDDGNIPEIDLPKDVIPDEVPRKDGPGGEGSGGNKADKSALNFL